MNVTVSREDDIEAIARSIDPAAFEEVARLLALTWQNKPAPAPSRAAEVISPVILKAEVIVVLLIARGWTPPWLSGPKNESRP